MLYCSGTTDTVSLGLVDHLAQGICSYRIGVGNNAPTSFVGGFVVNGAMTEPILTSTFNFLCRAKPSSAQRIGMGVWLCIGLVGSGYPWRVFRSWQSALAERPFRRF